MLGCEMVSRAWRPLLAAAALAAGLVQGALAQDKVTFATTWFAQAEHGGYYQAVAEGIYKKHGLDVTIKMGGPQVNGMQLLLAGQSDFIINYDFAVLQGVEKGFPLVTVAAPGGPLRTRLDGQLAFAMKRLKELQVVSGGDAATQGIGAMTDARWKKTADFMVEWSLLKPETDYRKAYTLQFVKDLKVMP